MKLARSRLSRKTLDGWELRGRGPVPRIRDYACPQTIDAETDTRARLICLVADRRCACQRCALARGAGLAYQGPP